MLKIAYITDSHLGAHADGFHQQPCWVGGLPTLLDRLRQFIAAQEIDLLVHGGDLVESATPEQIDQSLAQIASLGVPVLMCLGNHDVCRQGAFAQWRKAVGAHDAITLADAHHQTDEADLYILNNHWTADGRTGMFWDPTPPFRYVPGWADGQLAWLDERLARFRDRPAIVIVHTQVDAIHTQTMPELDEYIPDQYTLPFKAVLDRHAHCRLVLCGHCHVTASVAHGPRMHVTTGAFCEAPFQVRLLEVGQRAIGVSTVTMGPTPDGLNIDPARAWTLGEKADRQFVLPLCGG